MVEAVIDKRQNGLIIKDIEGKGRGIVTTKTFKCGDFVVGYVGELISLQEAKLREIFYSQYSEVGCYMFYLVFREKQYCIDAIQESNRIGRLINHCKLNQNLLTRLVEVNGKPNLIFVARKDLDIDGELLFDYGDHSKESIAAHPWFAF